jgi:hypothetical protein
MRCFGYCQSSVESPARRLILLPTSSQTTSPICSAVNIPEFLVHLANGSPDRGSLATAL